MNGEVIEMGLKENRWLLDDFGGVILNEYMD